jgi:hypothetical protein
MGAPLGQTGNSVGCDLAPIENSTKMIAVKNGFFIYMVHEYLI